MPWRSWLSRPFIAIIKATKTLPEDERKWQCPLCDAALPQQAQRPRQRSVQAHRLQCHPKVPIQKWKKALASQKFKGKAKTQTLVDACKRRGIEYRKRQFPSHDIVEIICQDGKAKKHRRTSQFWCMGCATKLGGYGGGSKTRHDKLTCKQSQKLSNPRQRVARAWQVLKGRVTTEGDPVEQRIHVWVRNLLEDGDIEANPGPSAASTSRHGIRPFRMLCANVGGLKGLYHALRLAVSDKVDVFALQETCLRKRDEAAFVHWAFRQGYCFHNAAGYENGNRGHRGAGILVRKEMRARLCKTWQLRGAQATAVVVEGVICISIYARDEDAAEVHQGISELLSVQMPHVPWLLCGDHNELPSESRFCNWLQEQGVSLLALRDHKGGLRPTRHGGHRCIDYGLTNCPHAVQLREAQEACIADHLVLAFDVASRSTLQDEVVCQLHVAPSCARPEGIDLQEWQEKYQTEWRLRDDFSHDIPDRTTDQSEVDALWTKFANCAANALHGTYLHFGGRLQANGHQTARGTKNSVNLVQGQAVSGSARMPASSFRERKLQRVVHRLQELVRLNKAGLQQTREFSQLWKKVQAHLQDCQGSVDHMLAEARARLRQCRKDLDESRLSQWRQKLNSSESACFKWVKNAKLTPMANVSSEACPELGVSDSYSSALHVLTEHWGKIWNRPLTWREHEDDIMQCTPAQPEQVWNDLSPDDLKAASHRLRGRAAGPDGWHGDELAGMPQCLWECVCKLYTLFEHSGLTPSIWKSARQCHVPKAGAVTCEGWAKASKLRPITIMSSWYRLWGCARLHSESTKHWLSSWWPSEALGGKKGCSVSDALCVIGEAALSREGYLLCLDYSLAFDKLDPQLAIRLMQKAGMPAQTAALLCGIWTAQERILQYGGACSQAPSRVSTSLPQGDTWSMVSMVLALAGPTRAINANHPDVVTRTWVDDRTIVATSAEKVVQVRAEWAFWSRALNLEENDNKTTFFHASAAGRRALRDAGVEEAKVTTSPAVLGVQLRGRCKRSNTAEESKRLQQAIALASRCQHLPVPWSMRKRVLAGQMLSLATWGWTFRRPPIKDVRRLRVAVCRALREGNTASVPLRDALRGHSLDFDLRVTQDICRCVDRHVRKCGQSLQCATIEGNLHRFLKRMGWTKNDATWTWRHEPMGMTFSLQHGRLKNAKCLGHDLRESWRWSKWTAFRVENRRDAALLRGVPYCARRMKSARLCAADRFLWFQILCGATVSPAVLGELECPWCHDAVPTWHHLVWECNATPEAENRPPMQGLDELSLRLGWPDSDKRVLHWMAHVRQLILKHRYQG